MKDEVNTLGEGKRNRKQDNNKYYNKQNSQRNLKKRLSERRKDKPLILNLDTGSFSVFQ